VKKQHNWDSAGFGTFRIYKGVKGVIGMGIFFVWFGTFRIYKGVKEKKRDSMGLRGLEPSL
jgi:hypothetical protein